MQKTGLKNLKKKIRIAHSPDADDAFMFYALAENLIVSENFEFEHELKDIQTLNKESNAVNYDVQAISFFAYPDVEDRYQLLSCGGSVGNGYGPLIVSKSKLTGNPLEILKNQKIAVPGDKTTAYLLLKLLLSDFKPVFIPFDQIIDVVKKGEVSFGLIIHEGQLSYLNHGLHKIIDLGEWWLGKTNLPVPLGGNIIRRSLDDASKKEINCLIRKSIAYALNNKDRIISSVSKYARELEDDKEKISNFVSMYVNDFTLDYGVSGKIALRKLYQLAFEKGFINRIPLIDFVE